MRLRAKQRILARVQEQRTYAIVGAGALGVFYGARLQRAGCEVHFLVRSDYEHVREHGWEVESKDGDFRLPQIRAYRDPREMPQCDVVLVALKATQNHLLPHLLPPLLKEHSVVVMMQNGLGAEGAAAAVAGPRTVLGGLCFICSQKTGPGHIQHLDYGYVRFGEYAFDGRPRGITEALRGIGEDFQRAGILVSLSEDLVLARWQKLIWNVPYNGLSVILNANTAELMAQTETRQLVEAIMREVAADAAALGRSVSESFIQKMLADTAKMTPYHASMKIDFDARRPMEVEAIYGNPLCAAQRAGAASPLLETLYRQLKFLDERNR